MPTSVPSPMPVTFEPVMADWHQLHQAALARMSDLANALDRQGWMDVDRACRWLHEELCPHHDREERELLPLLAAVDARPLGRQLRAEHREMGHLTLALLHGHAAGRVHDLVRHGARARRLLNLVRQHIDIEEHVLLPLIQGQPLPSRSNETGEGYRMLPLPRAAAESPGAYPRA